MFIERKLQPHLVRLAGQYPVVTITGPRQSGKTTLCRKTFPEMAYVSLESPDVRMVAENDPRAFFQRWPTAVIDEIQRVPSLLSYIQGIVDETDQAGQFILTGSAQLELMESVTQSLAGRTALLELLPFSYDELYRRHADDEPTLNDLLYTGLFPRIHDRGLNPTEAYAFYTETYIERDVRAVLNIKDRSLFDTFLRLVAGQSGRLLNRARLADDVGVAVNTISSWLSVLETGFVISFLRPHHASFRKRMIKSPKLYFVDTGLLCYLLGVTEASQLASHPLRGSIFETFVVGELRKQACNRAVRPALSFFRSSDGHEVDVLDGHGRSVRPIEIKSAATVRDRLADALKWYAKLNPEARSGTIIYGGEESFPRTGFDILSFRAIERME